MQEFSSKGVGAVGGGRVACIAGAALAACGSAFGQPGTPRYQTTVADCTTGDNAFIGDDGARYWTVDPGCDIYQIDLYERPTVSFYETIGGRYATNEYFEYLDIESASFGLDDRYVFVRIDLYGRDNSTSGGDDIEVGMMERYGFRFSTDPDGRFGVLIVADQPEVKNEPNTVFGPLGVSGYRDTDGDVGGADRDGPTGLEVTKTDNPDEADGLDGFDRAFIADGELGDETLVAWVRLSPLDDTVVELALDYRALGFTRDQMESLRYFDAEAIKGGPKDPQNYLWNDKYTAVEAGSPNPGGGGDSEFGTEGLENIYEADTVRLAIACPADLDGDGDADADDFFAYLDAFSAGDLGVCDLDGDGDCDADDFFGYLDRFALGC